MPVFCRIAKPAFRKEMQGELMPVKKLSGLYFSFTMLIVASIVACILLQAPYTNKDDGYTLLIKTGKTLRIQDELIPTGKLYYGNSGLGKPLVCIKISPPKQAKTKILMTYEIHGYEDEAPKDGRVLVRMANLIVRYFMNHKSALGGSTLYIVPSVNPDGLSDGYTNQGPGRCQVTLGIDLNRDFDRYFVTDLSSRNHTLSKPFSAPESRALRDLIETVKPDVVIDCHGWANQFIGDGWLADCFKSSLGISVQQNFSTANNGYLSVWAASRGAKAMLIEYPKAAYYADPGVYADRTVNGIKNLVAQLK
jgi:hypothetical protein